MYMILISSCACWVCIKHQIDVITLSPSHQKCNVIIGNDVIFFCVCHGLCVAFCIFVFVSFYTVLKHCCLYLTIFHTCSSHTKQIEEQYLCIFQIREWHLVGKHSLVLFSNLSQCKLIL